MRINHAKEYLIFVHIVVVFLHFLARASNGPQYSNFENKYPKLGTATPEDMLFTNLCQATWTLEIGIALTYIFTIQHCAGNVAPWDPPHIFSFFGLIIISYVIILVENCRNCQPSDEPLKIRPAEKNLLLSAIIQFGLTYLKDIFYCSALMYVQS